MKSLMWDARFHPQVAGFVAEKWPLSLEVLLSFTVCRGSLRCENKDSGNCVYRWQMGLSGLELWKRQRQHCVTQ